MSFHFSHRKARISQTIAQPNIDVFQVGAKSDYPRPVYFLFLFFALYLTIPIVDVPLLGLSLSAPIFFLVALPVFLRSPHPWLESYRKWIMIAVAIWLGIFLSAMMNGLLSGGTQIDRDGWISLVRFAYWLLTFVVTVYLISSQPGLGERLVGAIAVGIALLGLLRLGEAFFGGAIGAWTSLQFMTQNSYGIQFSTFFPVLLSFAYWGKHRGIAILAILAAVAAVLINGSRTGWLGALAGTLVFLCILLFTQRQHVRSVIMLFFLGSVLGLAALLVPDNVISAFEKRLGTFQTLEQDKSYVIRQLMVQKGLGLFQGNPAFGVGVSRWRKESVPLELPKILRYAPQSHFDSKSSHNSYVSYLAETGLAGSIPLAVLLLILAFGGYRAASRLARRGQVWAAGVYAGFVGMSVHLWALSGLTGTAPWFIYGMVAGMIAMERQLASFLEKDFHAPRLSLPRSRRF